MPQPDAIDVLSPLYAFCRERGFEPEGEAIREGDWPVQFIPAFSPLTESAIREAETSDVDGVPLRVVRADYRAVIALSVGRAKDFARILALQEAGAVSDEQIRLHHLPGLRYRQSVLEADAPDQLEDAVAQSAPVRRRDIGHDRFYRWHFNRQGIAFRRHGRRSVVACFFLQSQEEPAAARQPQRAKVKEVASPKFYLFDPGVARALAGRVREPLDSAERGFLLETWVLHELRAAIAFRGLGGQLHYWRTPSGSEVDFVWTRGNQAIGVEVKASAVWRGEYGAPIKALLDEGVLTAAHGIYTGTKELKDGALRIWPLQSFFRELTDGRILG